MPPSFPCVSDLCAGAQNLPSEISLVHDTILGAEVRKTVGDVATVLGVGSGIVVVQAAPATL